MNEQKKVRGCIYAETGMMKTGSARSLLKCGLGKLLLVGDEVNNAGIVQNDPSIKPHIIEIPNDGNKAAVGSAICERIKKVLGTLKAPKPPINWVFFDGLSQLVKCIHDEIKGNDERISLRDWGTVEHRAMQIVDELYYGPWPVVIFTALEEVKELKVQVKTPGNKTPDEITVKIEGKPALMGKLTWNNVKPWKVGIIGHVRPPIKTNTGWQSMANFQMESGPGFQWMGKDQISGKLGLEKLDWYEIVKKLGRLPPGVK